MSARPSYYSGRGATLSDLDGEKLLKIQESIIANHGNDAGKSFFDMVVSMREMNATDFINNLYTLEANGWKWSAERAEKCGIDIEKDEHVRHNLVSALATAGAMMSRHGDDTDRIKRYFLAANREYQQSFNGPQGHKF